MCAIARNERKHMDFKNRGSTDGKPDNGEPGRRHAARRTIFIMGRQLPMPRSRRLRITIGIVLIILGFFGFLPVLGFWMIPVGVLVLSYEFATVRRLRRRFEIWWAERRGRRRIRKR